MPFATRSICKKDLKTELRNLLINFQLIPELITSIQAKNMMLSYSIQIVEKLNIKLPTINIAFDDTIRTIYNFLIQENKSLEVLKKINSIVKGEECDIIDFAK